MQSSTMVIMFYHLFYSERNLFIYTLKFSRTKHLSSCRTKCNFCSLSDPWLDFAVLRQIEIFNNKVTLFIWLRAEDLEKQKVKFKYSVFRRETRLWKVWFWVDDLSSEMHMWPAYIKSTSWNLRDIHCSRFEQNQILSQLFCAFNGR